MCGCRVTLCPSPEFPRLLSTWGSNCCSIYFLPQAEPQGLLWEAFICSWKTVHARNGMKSQEGENHCRARKVTWPCFSFCGCRLALPQVCALILQAVGLCPTQWFKVHACCPRCPKTPCHRAAGDISSRSFLHTLATRVQYFILCIKEIKYALHLISICEFEQGQTFLKGECAHCNPQSLQSVFLPFLWNVASRVTSSSGGSSPRLGLRGPWASWRWAAVKTTRISSTWKDCFISLLLKKVFTFY